MKINKDIFTGPHPSLKKTTEYSPTVHCGVFGLASNQASPEGRPIVAPRIHPGVNRSDANHNEIPLGMTRTNVRFEHHVMVGSSPPGL